MIVSAHNVRLEMLNRCFVFVGSFRYTKQTAGVFLMQTCNSERCAILFILSAYDSLNSRKIA